MFATFNSSLKIPKGMSVIELMLAMALGLTILSFLFEAYLAHHRSDQLQASLYEIQHNAKRAIALLNTAIKQAGYIGCPRLSPGFLIKPYSAYSITAKNKLVGEHNKFTVRQAAFAANAVTETMQNNSELFISKKVKFSTRDILIISDCKHAELFQAASIVSFRSAQKLITRLPLYYRYSRDAEVSRLQINTYYIGKTKRKNANGMPIYALFRQDIKHHQLELVENITHMQLFYSIKSNGKIIDVTENAVTDWSQVLGMAISLELISATLQKTWPVYVSL